MSTFSQLHLTHNLSLYLDPANLAMLIHVTVTSRLDTLCKTAFGKVLEISTSTKMQHQCWINCADYSFASRSSSKCQLSPLTSLWNRAFRLFKLHQLVFSCGPVLLFKQTSSDTTFSQDCLYGHILHVVNQPLWAQSVLSILEGV